MKFCIEGMYVCIRLKINIKFWEIWKCKCVLKFLGSEYVWMFRYFKVVYERNLINSYKECYIDLILLLFYWMIVFIF